jgi:hypothetical protein
VHRTSRTRGLYRRARTALSTRASNGDTRPDEPWICECSRLRCQREPCLPKRLLFTCRPLDQTWTVYWLGKGKRTRIGATSYRCGMEIVHSFRLTTTSSSLSSGDDDSDAGYKSLDASPHPHPHTLSRSSGSSTATMRAGAIGSERATEQEDRVFRDQWLQDQYPDRQTEAAVGPLRDFWDWTSLLWRRRDSTRSSPKPNSQPFCTRNWADATHD